MIAYLGAVSADPAYSHLKIKQGAVVVIYNTGMYGVNLTKKPPARTIVSTNRASVTIFQMKTRMTTS